MSKLLSPNSKNIEFCKTELENSQVLAVPTETVFGLAANALDPDAVRKIFEIKDRPLIDPLILHTTSIEEAKLYCHLNLLSKKLASCFWPGPLTLVLPKKSIVPDIVTAGLKSVAIRCPYHPTLRKLLKILPFPLAAPSANPFGYISPTKAEHVKESLGPKIKYILDGDPCKIGIESTIVDIRDSNNPKILRPGPITQSMLENAGHTSFKNIHGNPKSNPDNGFLGPGLLDNHYSPKASLKLIRKSNIISSLETNFDHKTAYLFHAKPTIFPELIKQRKGQVFWLSENGSIEIIAKNLYNQLRIIDKMRFDKILVENFETNEGFKSALIDRLKKAAD